MLPAGDISPGSAFCWGDLTCIQSYYKFIYDKSTFATEESLTVAVNVHFAKAFRLSFVVTKPPDMVMSGSYNIARFSIRAKSCRRSV